MALRSRRRRLAKQRRWARRMGWAIRRATCEYWRKPGYGKSTFTPVRDEDVFVLDSLREMFNRCVPIR